MGWRLLGLVFACFMPLWLGATIQIHHVYMERRDAALGQTLQMTRFLVSAVDQDLAEIEAALRGLATSPAFLSEDFAALHRQATDLVGLFPNSDIVIAGDTGQQVVNSYLPFGTRLPSRNNPEVVRRVFQQGKPFVTNMFRGAVTGRNLVSIDVPVFREGVVAFDLAMTFPTERLGTMLLRQKLPAGAIGALIDGNGVVVARTRDADRFVGQHARPALLQARIEAADGVFEDATLEGIPVFTVFSRSAKSGWTVAIGVPSDTLLASLRQWLWWTVGGAILSSASGIVLAVLVGQRIARANNNLVKSNLALLEEIAQRERAERSLHEEQVKLRGLFELSPLGIALTDMDGRFLQFNEAFRRICGYPADELKTLDYWSLTPERYAPDQAEAFESLQRCGLYGPFEKEYRRKDGSLVPLRVNGMLLIGSEGQRYLWAIAEDISERRKTEAHLHLAANVFAHAREGIVVTDSAGTIVELNDSFTRMTGYSRDELLGRNPRVLCSGLHPREFYAAMWRALREQGYWSGEIWNRRKSGEVFAELLTISAVRGADGQTQNYVGLSTDITTMKEHQKQLEHFAHYDPLTGLPNRVLLADRLKQAMLQSHRRDRMLAVVYLDLDGFKEVNDSYGHRVGDDLLVTVAERMKAVLREGDTLARVGGDEFVALLVDLERPEDCEPVLVRLLGAAAEPVVAGEATLQVSASIGVALFPRDGQDSDQLVRRADSAMYRAKKTGGNAYRPFDGV